MNSTRKGNLFIFLFILYFILMGLVIGLLSDILQIDNPLVTLAISQVTGIFFALIFYIKVTHEPIQKTFKLYNPGTANILLTIILVPFLIPITSLINNLSQIFVSSPITSTLSTIKDTPFLFSLIVVAVFPAIFEELLSRGVFVQNYKNKSMITASIMSGVIFGMIHLNINQFLYAFFLGFIFSVIMHLTGSIIPAMLMHFSLNAFSVIKLYIIPTENATNTTNTSNLSTQALNEMIIFSIFSLVFILLIIYGFIRINDRRFLLKTKATSAAYFDQKPEISVSEAYDYSQVHTNELTKPTMKTKEDEPILTVPLILFSIVFIILSILQEL